MTISVLRTETGVSIFGTQLIEPHRIPLLKSVVERYKELIGTQQAIDLAILSIRIKKKQSKAGAVGIHTLRENTNAEYLQKLHAEVVRREHQYLESA